MGFGPKEENYFKKSSEKEHFYSREILLYIAWACFRNGFDGRNLVLIVSRPVPLLLFLVKSCVQNFDYLIFIKLKNCALSVEG